jgi:uncharacterized protein
VTYLVDGYNWMFAAGLASKALPAARWEKARTKFLDWLAPAASRAELRVVFDAQNAPARSSEEVVNGVRVLFAYRQTADDRIEELLAREARPERLTVVSNDARVREAARRAGSAFLSCEAFTDWLISAAPPPRAAKPATDEKPTASASEPDLLAAFTAPKRPR